MKEIAITAWKCRRCGKLHYPYHDRCLACRGREFDPALADCGYRAPLAPRLARPRRIVTESGAFVKETTVRPAHYLMENKGPP